MKIRRIIALNLFLVGMSAEVLEIKKVKDLIFYHVRVHRHTDAKFIYVFASETNILEDAYIPFA